MGTTYYNYQISYNGNVIVNGGAMATNVSMTYGGVETSLLNVNQLCTAGKYLQTDVIISGGGVTNTLATANKFLEQNIMVNVGSAYYWNKYTVGKTYTQVTQNVTPTGSWNNCRYNLSATTAGNNGLYYKASVTSAQFSFSTATGKYTQTGSTFAKGGYSSRTSTMKYGPIGHSVVFGSSDTSASSYSGNYAVWAYTYNTAVAYYYTTVLQVQAYSSYWYLYATSHRNNATALQSNKTFMYVYSSSAQSARGNYIETVGSAQNNAYPSNGLHTDGYWYTLVQDYYWDKYEAATITWSSTQINNVTGSHVYTLSSELEPYMGTWINMPKAVWENVYFNSSDGYFRRSDGQPIVSSYNTNTYSIAFVNNYSAQAFSDSDNVYVMRAYCGGWGNTRSTKYTNSFTINTLISASGGSDGGIGYVSHSDPKGNYLGIVASSNEYAYPTNGKHTDGYWYVKR